MCSQFRDHLFPLDHPRLASLRQYDACGYADAMRSHPLVGDALDDWIKLFETTEFRGITSDGTVIPGLFESGVDEAAPTAEAVDAATSLLAALTLEQRDHVTHPLDSKVWRAWMNPEFYVNRFGLRLEELDAGIRDHVLALVRASVSPAGYRKVRDVMQVNDYLGDLVGLPKILNENSYNINIFGEPSGQGPWGWSLYGHHLCLNSLFIGEQQIFAPVFFGAEPNEIDAGEHAGTALFTEQERAGLAFVQALPTELATRAVLFKEKRDPDLPVGRIHPGDELHLGGAFQDNRIIGYEGLPLTECSPALADQLIDLVSTFLDYQPDGPRRARLAEVRRHLDQTWFCWIGGTSYGDAFYFRIQSPVIVIEFDHHAGIFLANPEPERFHVHTLVRIPNGNDYGVELVRRTTGTKHLLDGPA